MEIENAIEVKNVKKSFKIYFDKGILLRDKLLFFKRNRNVELKVLDDISFSIQKGEGVGLIGHNGCGKSTTLKLLTRIMYPDAGTVEMKGRVSSLLELGAGFHPDMTGKENIYINASIFGLTKKEIDSRIDDIINFAELGEFLNNPVRTYSSGMYMRLAFAVAINVNADILLIDEILAVGDVNFRAKCFKKLKEIKEEGTTIVIVSHSLEQIEAFCNRSIWLHDGKIMDDGVSKEVHKNYLAFMKSHNGTSVPAPVVEKPVLIDEVKLFDKDGKENYSYPVGGTFKIKINYKIIKKMPDAIFSMIIYGKDNVFCYGTNTQMDGLPLTGLDSDGELFLQLGNIWLQPGKYRMEVIARDGKMNVIDRKNEACSFHIVGKTSRPGIIFTSAKWERSK